MRLLMQNMLQCPRTGAHPLRLRAETCDEVSMTFSEKLIRRLIARIDWSVFLEAAEQLPDPDMIAKLPTEPPGDDADESVLRAIHRALLEWHVVEGSLECDSACYHVRNGIPNLVLTEVRKDTMDVESADAGRECSEPSEA